MNSYLKLVVLLTIFPFQGSWAQLIVQGKVFTGTGTQQQPVAFANVFLSNTTKGVLTDSTGSFILNNVPIGKFDLVVSFVGYTTLKTAIQTQDQKAYRFILKPLENELNAVTVKARRRKTIDWTKQLAIFTDNFIGKSENASQCQLVNSQVLQFEQTDNELTVKAKEPLIINNQALGYRIKFQLERFTYSYDTYLVSYEGNPVFEPLIPKNQQEEQRWQENRLKAYLGSIMHFGRALYHRQLIEEGFLFVKVIDFKNRSGELTRISRAGDTLVTCPSLVNPHRDMTLQTAAYKVLVDTVRSTPLQTILSFSDYIQVTYVKESEPHAFQCARRSSTENYGINPQKSLIRLLAPNVTVEANGQFWPSHSIRSEGYWTWELIADDLPFDYEPGRSSTSWLYPTRRQGNEVYVR